MIRHTGANMETVRRKNRATILQYINDHGPASRKDLADVIGLTPAAVTQICTELLREGILQETGQNVEQSGAGRKKVLLDIDYRVAYVYAINIEPEYTTIALSDLKGEQIACERLKTDASIAPETFLKHLAKRCQKMAAAHKKAVPHIAAAGVGITGLVDRAEGSSIKAYGIWEDEVPIARILGQVLELPVFVENNVNAFAVAEQLYGAGREYDHLMVIKWGPGVGCAMIIDQKIYEGRHAKAAELGHFIVEKNGALCHCGRRGCLETKVSYPVLNRITPFAEEEFGLTYCKAKGHKEGIAFDEAIDLFARSIVNSATIMAPNRILLTGSLFASQIIRDELVAACSSYDTNWGEGKVIYSQLSDREHYIGPAAVCVNRLLFGES